MLASVIVFFPENRDVLVNGAFCGTTNKIFSVQSGHQTFDLGLPVDYLPLSQDIIVPENTPLNPQVIVFDKVIHD